MGHHGENGGVTCLGMTICFTGWIFGRQTKPDEDMQESSRDEDGENQPEEKKTIYGHCVEQQESEPPEEKTISSHCDEDQKSQQAVKTVNSTSTGMTTTTETQPGITKIETTAKLVLLGLPTHLVDNVLLVSSVKTLLRIRHVCRAWRSRIDDPSFIASHLKIQKNHVGIINRYRNKLSILSVEKSSMPLCAKVTHVWLPEHEPASVRALAGCNGLICLERNTSTCDLDLFYIVNFATRRFIDLPSYPGRRRYMYGDEICELAFDASSGFYKMLLGGEDNMMILSVGVDASWRCLGQPSWLKKGDRFWSSIHSQVSSSSIHWTCERLIHGDPDCIVAFDLHKEDFTTMPCPNCCPNDHFCRDPFNPRLRSHRVCLFEREGMLCFLHFDDLSVNIDLWSLQEYESGFWVKEYSLERESIPGGLNTFRHTCFISAFGDMIMLDVVKMLDGQGSQRWRLILYHPHKRRIYSVQSQYENLEVGTKFWSASNVPCYESLVHLKGFKPLGHFEDGEVESDGFICTDYMGY